MTMLQLSMDDLLWGERPFLVVVSPAKTSQPPIAPERGLTGSDQDFTERLSESQKNADRIGFSLRMCISSSIEGLIGFCPTWTQKATAQQRLYFQAQQPEAPINANVSGWLHTPTRAANQLAPSMMKHECCRNFRDTYGDRLEPWMFEQMMGFPMGWTALDGADCNP